MLGDGVRVHSGAPAGGGGGAAAVRRGGARAAPQPRQLARAALPPAPRCGGRPVESERDPFETSVENALNPSWGVTHVNALAHITNPKHHFTHSLDPGQGARRGGGLRIGSMEGDMLVASGLPNVMQELRNRGGTQVVPDTLFALQAPWRRCGAMGWS